VYKELSGRRDKRIRSDQRTLGEFGMPAVEFEKRGGESDEALIYRLPQRVNWDALRVAYEKQPANYEQFLYIRGVGPATVRALALISELIYGEPPSWRDPVKFSFAFGGKDGVPYPVDRKTMDETTELLRTAMKHANVKILE
jgi:hypothetical protein